ncbi:nitrous oxide reductase accessory protein NosL [Propionivibrio sp.]|uniref:nitrous oxide reductase accessory protein NosL n=1 Tax=Propionivibrio sp. TaxID=2212460 RepID=UPI002614819E|nr:nitrous oxide reductase accessory protein NosL [Propionivibrio sp.]
MNKAFSWPAAITVLSALFSASLLLTGCGEKTTPVQALEISEGTACALDGMVLQDFPGPKAQILYEHSEPEFFCDTREMFSIFLRPEQKKRIAAIYTQDMGKTDWAHPQGHWIDAKTAFYVLGSSRSGSMGPTVVSFAAEADAQGFSTQYGGKVLRFDQVTLDMVDLRGGIVHDEKM